MNETVTFDMGSSRDFAIGLSLAVSSCFFIGASFVIKKMGLIRLSKRGGNSVRASDGGYGYLKDWVWWAGLLTMGLGEAANFAAYAFAPASLVTPMGALSIVISAVLASHFLREYLNLLGKLGCFLCILGSTVFVIHAPKEGDVASMDELYEKIFQSGFFIYIVVIGVVSLLTVRFIVPRYGNTHVAVYIFICSSIGSLSVMCCKGIGLAVRETVAGTANQFASVLTWVFIISLVSFIAVQMNYLNKALDIFHTAIVTPVYYVMFTSFVILASSILFQEWKTMNGIDILGDVCGFLIVIVAIFLLNAFKDMKIALHDVMRSRKDPRDKSESLEALL